MPAGHLRVPRWRSHARRSSITDYVRKIGRWLEGVSPLTVTLPDVPGRPAAEIPTDRFQRKLKRDDKNPPRAAIEVADAPKDADVVVVELRDPVYNASKRSAKYDVRC